MQEITIAPYLAVTWELPKGQTALLPWPAFPQSLSQQELFSNYHTKLLPPIGHMCTACCICFYPPQALLIEQTSSPKYIALRASLYMHHHVEGLVRANATSKSV